MCIVLNVFCELFKIFSIILPSVVLAVPELLLELPVGVEVLGSVLAVPELLLELELVESISDVVLDPVEPEK